MRKDYYLYLSQDKKQFFQLPPGWVPTHFVEDEEGISLPSIEQMTLEAFSNPTGTDSLPNRLSRAKNIAIIVDDGTRPTPVTEILETLLPYLVDHGSSRANIAIIVALGTHEAMNRKDLEARLGKGVVSNYKIVQHNAWQSDLIPVKIPGDGGVVRINPEVAQADFRLGISSILPHPMAGYGGGPKILMPGLCNFEFIRDHHMKHVIDPGSMAGTTKGNPFHQGIFNVARAIGLDFSINCVYNQKGQVIRIIAGSLEKAFEDAVGVCFEKLEHKFEEKVDVTITSTFPHTHGHQLFKGLSAPDRITKDSGAILLVAPIVAPIPAEFLNSFRVINEKSRGNSVAYVKDALSNGMAFLPDKSIDYNMAMSTVFLRPRIRTLLVSPVISADQAQTMGLEYSSSIEEGLRSLEKSYPHAKVAIFPSGGLIVPIIAGGDH